MDKWFVKTVENKVYGPVDVTRLVGWAKEGRLEPGSFLSQDRRRWMPAAAMRELGMCWMVGTEDGETFGPFHADVLQALRDNGEVTSAARIYRLFSADEEDACSRVRGERDRLAQDLQRAVEEKEKLAESLARQNDELVAVRGDLAHARQDLVAEQERILVEQARAQQVVAVAQGKNEADVAEARRIAEDAVAERKRAESERQRAEEQLALARKTIEEEHARAARLGKVFAQKMETYQSAAESAQKRIAELEAIAKKKSKAGWGGLFSGSKGPDLAMIELAARRELAAARNQTGARASENPPKAPGDVIDIG